MTATSSSVRNTVPLQNKYDRIVLLVDMDCFYCQVEEKLDPALKGQPLAVVQYNAWRGGGIIAVNYAARAKGVTRHMRGDEAKEQCPNIVLVKVPNVREKADLSKYRDAGREVANVLQRYTQLLERASVDEAYLDITESVNKRLQSLNEGTFVLQPQELVNTYAVGYANIGEYVNKITTRFTNPYMDDEKFLRIHEYNDLPSVRQSDIRLLIGASIVGEIRAAVKSVTGYECSAGIAHNKILAKLACGINKPNKQTILPLDQIPELFETLAVGKITGLGGKFGEDVCERLNIKYLGQLLRFTEAELQRKFNEKNGTWLFYMSRGIELEAVTPRFYSKSIGCCKKFPGRNSITGLKTLQHWLKELANEINERLEKDVMENNRKAKQMVVSYIQEFDNTEVSSSRSVPLTHYDRDILAMNALNVITTNTKTFFRQGSEAVLNNPIKFLGISTGKFETISNAQAKLQDMFANQAAKKRRISEDSTQTSTNTPEIGSTPQPMAVDEKPKEHKDIEKKKGFLENYLQNKREDSNATSRTIENPNMLDTTVKSSATSTIESCFLRSRKRNHELLETNVKPIESADDSNPASEKEVNLPATNQSSKKSYFANYFAHHQKENVIQDSEKQVCKEATEIKLTQTDQDHDEANEAKAPVLTSESFPDTSDADESAEAEIELLARELEDIERSNEKTKELCDSILSLDKGTGQVGDLEPKVNLNDYKNSYAEFAMPVVDTGLLKLVKCDECGANVPDDARSLQSHQDHHFAQQLSQQQRAEYRSEVQSKLNVVKAPPNNKMSKKAKKPTGGAGNSPANQTGIAKYLKAKTDTHTEQSHADLNDSPSTTAAAAEPMELCSECQKYVKTTQLSEHMDFHVAKQLQRKINQLEVRTVVVAKKPNATASKKQQNSSSLNSTQSSSTNKSITQFFAPPN